MEVRWDAMISEQKWEKWDRFTSILAQEQVTKYCNVYRSLPPRRLPPRLRLNSETLTTL